jgi:2,4-dienoyl-CoA reductase (NADPH2)
VTPRDPKIPGSDGANVLSYIDVLLRGKSVGERVAIVGAGGIGFDVAEFLVQHGASSSLDSKRWMAEWGVDPTFEAPGSLIPAQPEAPAREVWLLQRTPGRPGAKLGKTSGWVHRATLKAKGVRMLGGVEYLGVDDEGLHVRIDGSTQTLAVDTVVICAGQEPRRDLADALKAAGVTPHLIGGADVAAELDAKRAIDQASRLAASL